MSIEWGIIGAVRRGFKETNEKASICPAADKHINAG